MIEIDSYLIETLALMKHLYDEGLTELMDIWSSTELSGDYLVEMAYEAIASVFMDTRGFFNEDYEIESHVFCDPLMDTFCRLCEEYERRRKIEPKENSFRKSMERAIRAGLTFNSYDYNYTWYLEPQERGKRRIVLLTGAEFYSMEQVPFGLIEVRDAFKEHINRLRQALYYSSSNILMLPAPLAQHQEAAA